MDLFFRKRLREAEERLRALDRVQAVIEFGLDGCVLSVNDNYLDLVGYERAEVVGQHHRIFVPPGAADDAAYGEFWDHLRKGEFHSGQLCRVRKDGEAIWIHASYNPVFDADGRVYKVIKFASDITRRKGETAEYASLLAAIDKSQGVITFDLEGHVLDANANILQSLGYDLEEVRGRHHTMFVDPDEREGAAYARFWRSLRSGEFQRAQYRRIGKNGREVWIQATYNPVLDPWGRPVKVVKLATDVTDRVRLLERLKTLLDENFSEVERAMALTLAATGNVERSADVTSGQVRSMATATSSIAASVKAISDGLRRSQEASEGAFDQVGAAAGSTRQLADTMQSITATLALIHEIAGQINLLALNATIESARAGEMGRGFAVVAQEVKLLAEQAAATAKQITAQIGSAESVSEAISHALTAACATVSTMRSDLQAAAADIETQRRLADTLSADMQRVAASVEYVPDSIREIAQLASHTGQAIGSTRRAAEVLAR
jgi:methyl-accepting chemotaxis protein